VLQRLFAEHGLAQALGIKPTGGAHAIQFRLRARLHGIVVPSALIEPHAASIGRKTTRLSAVSEVAVRLAAADTVGATCRRSAKDSIIGPANADDLRGGNVDAQKKESGC
jgi:hypothetical protein